jgi:hypothetical protein
VGRNEDENESTTEESQVDIPRNPPEAVDSERLDSRDVTSEEASGVFGHERELAIQNPHSDPSSRISLQSELCQRSYETSPPL